MISLYLLRKLKMTFIFIILDLIPNIADHEKLTECQEYMKAVHFYYMNDGKEALEYAYFHLNYQMGDMNVIVNAYYNYIFETFKPCIANSDAVGPVLYCYTNEEPNLTSAIDQYNPINSGPRGQELYINLYNNFISKLQNIFTQGESSTAASTQLPNDQYRPPGYSNAPSHEFYWTSNLPYSAGQFNPVTDNRLRFDLNKPPVQSSEDIPNTTNTSVQPSSSYYAPRQGFNYDLNYTPPDYQG